MKLIFDEYKYAEKLLETGFTKYLPQNEINILAKYYKYNDMDDKSIKEKLIEFCNKFVSGFNKTMHDDKLNYAIRYCNKYGINNSVDIPITHAEIEKIKQLKNYKIEKVLFIMLVYSRYMKLTRNYTDYYVNENFSTFLNIAKVYLNKDEKMKFKNNLHKLGYLDTYVNKKSKTAKKDNFKLLYADENSPVEIIVTDCDNIFSFYPNYFYCEKCGEKEENASPKTKKNLCDKCYQEKVKSDTLNRVNKFRRKQM